MSRPAFRSRAVRGRRLTLLLLGSLLIVPTSFGALALVGSASDGVQLAVILGVMLAYFALLVVGVRRCATYEVRHEVTRDRVREETGAEDAAQGPKEEDRAALQVFRDAFLAGVKAYRPAPGGAAIRARPSFFDGPVARVLAGAPWWPSRGSSCWS